MKRLLFIAFAAAFSAGAVSATTVTTPLINEIRPNPAGLDPANQQVELLGVAGASFSAVLLSLESDGITAQGKVDRLYNLSGMFDGNGIFTTSIADLENPSFTLVLTSSFSGSIGDDLDAGNDGSIDDQSVFGTIWDAVGVPDSVGDENRIYGADLGGTDLSFIGDEPQLIFRDGVSHDWLAVDDNGGTDDVFDADGNQVVAASFNLDPTVATFGAINPTAVAAVPLPATLPLLLAGLGLIALRRRS